MSRGKNKSRKGGKSPVSGWRSLFNRGKAQSFRKDSDTSVDGFTRYSSEGTCKYNTYLITWILIYILYSIYYKNGFSYHIFLIFPLHYLCIIIIIPAPQHYMGEHEALTEDDVARRRQLRSVRSADSLLSGVTMPSGHLSTGAEGGCIINPYAG